MNATTNTDRILTVLSSIGDISDLKKPEGKKYERVAFPQSNKNCDMNENDKYIKEGYYIENCLIVETIKVTDDRYRKLSTSLMCNNPEFKGDGGGCVVEDESLFDGVQEYSPEWLEIYREHGVTQCHKIVNAETGECFFSNNEGYDYARYTGITINRMMELRSSK